MDSKSDCGTGWASVFSWHSRTSLGSIGSVSSEITRVPGVPATGLPRRVAKVPTSTSPWVRSGRSIAKRGQPRCPSNGRRDGRPETEGVSKCRHILREIRCGSPPRDDPRRRDPFASGQKRGWIRAGETARARRSARSQDLQNHFGHSRWVSLLDIRNSHSVRKLD